ncbi:EscU/YscU/HrcU family type III secretion system export apparatus switch protein [Rhizobium etli]|uniref:EscU/YscU/HrcU family type III secretion system export apparatus switch protein n=1 Tax=Rhizobium etli TaxID=29449 RepID=UPI0003839928|nr:EscU/YscU/HrcU family type III secretion system export apparatus switch protein [Rhizobium etli]AGS25375.1 type III secretion system substrate-exporter protein [Rhizobium etli bv. mimosae str. Mim1]
MSNTSEEKKRPGTAKKLSEARKKGQIARNTDFVRAVGTCAGLGYVGLRASAIEDKCIEALLLTNKLQNMPFNIAVGQALVLFTELTVTTVGPLLGTVAAAGILAAFIANGGLIFSFQPMAPKFETINPFQGLKRVVSMRSLTEVGKALVKLLVLGGTFLLLILGMWKTMVYLPICGMGCFGFIFTDVKLLIAIGAGTLLVGGLIDLLLQRWLFLRDMRMTDTEVKRESKEQEGTPELKRERRRLRQEMASEPPLGVNHATLILKGRAILAGLRYVPGETGVPVLVCHSEGKSASHMLGEAQALRLTVVEDHVLARQLIQTVKLGKPIPMQYFEPVARALHAAGLV